MLHLNNNIIKRKKNLIYLLYGYTFNTNMFVNLYVHMPANAFVAKSEFNKIKLNKMFINTFIGRNKR